MKTIIFIGRVVDSTVFVWLFVLAANELLDASYFEGCALMCTAIFYQRAWKADMLRLATKTEKD